MRSEVISRSSVEQEELNQKRQELAHLQSELVEQELHLATLRAELSAFEEKYRRQVGVLHAELDEWKAKIAELVSKEEDTPEARSAAADARAQASQSYSEAHGEGTNTNEFSPTPELKKLYREVAKKVHPDYATDQADRNIRERLMADANRAYREGDADALRKIIEEYEASVESVKGVGVAAELIRVTLQIKQIQRRLVEIEQAIRSLSESEIAKLRAKFEQARKQGRDLLAEMAKSIKRSIDAESHRFEELSSKGRAL